MTKTKWFALITFFIITACNSDEINENYNEEFEITSITPLRAKIGDTITIRGKNLDKIANFYFRHDEGAPFEHELKYSYYPTDKGEEIKLKIPKLYYENVKIAFRDGLSFKLELVGLIPIITGYENYSRQIQTIDDSIAYATLGDKIYKSVDGFYTWNVAIEFQNSNITSFFFLDENIGWIAIMEESGRNIYFTQDGGKSLSLKYHINDKPNGFLDGSDIRKIQFISQNKGMFKDGNGNVFIADDSSWSNVYDYYPSLSALPFDQIELWDFKMIHDNLIFLTPSQPPYRLIKIDNQNITYSQFDIWQSAPQFFGDIGFVQGDNNIYKSSDLGDSWTIIKTFENAAPEVHFINIQEGFAFVNKFESEIYQTKNSGVTWENYITFSQFESASYGDFNQKTGLLGNSKGKLWKYRKE